MHQKTTQLKDYPVEKSSYISLGWFPSLLDWPVGWTFQLVMLGDHLKGIIYYIFIILIVLFFFKSY